MNRYKKYMQHIHSVGTATAIEMAVILLTEDIADFLVHNGIKADSPLINEVRKLKDYEYKPKKALNEDSNTKP